MTGETHNTRDLAGLGTSGDAVSHSSQQPRGGTDSEVPAAGSGQGKRIDWSKPRVAAILAQAARSFAREGFESTTALIARQIGVPKSIIYHYFVDKQQLIREVQRYVYGKHLDRVRGALETVGRPVGVMALQAVEALWRERRARDLRFELGVLSAMRHDPVLVTEARKLREAQRGMTAEVLARALGIEGAAPERVEPLATLVSAAVTGLAIAAHVEGDEGPALRAQRLLLQLLEIGVDEFGVSGETTLREACDSVPPPAPLGYADEDRISAGF